MTGQQPKAKDRPKESAAYNIMVWNMNGGGIPEGTLRRIEGAVTSIIGQCKRERLVYDIIKEPGGAVNHKGVA